MMPAPRGWGAVDTPGEGFAVDAPREGLAVDDGAEKIKI